MNFNELYNMLGLIAIPDSVINSFSLKELAKLTREHLIQMDKVLTLVRNKVVDKSMIKRGIESSYRIDDDTTIIIRTSFADNFTYIDFQSDSFEGDYQYALNNHEGLMLL